MSSVLLLLLFAAAGSSLANVVLEPIDDCSCASSSDERENIWECVVDAPDNNADHFESGAYDDSFEADPRLVRAVRAGFARNAARAGFARNGFARNAARAGLARGAARNVARAGFARGAARNVARAGFARGGMRNLARAGFARNAVRAGFARNVARAGFARNVARAGFVRNAARQASFRSGARQGLARAGMRNLARAGTRYGLARAAVRQAARQAARQGQARQASIRSAARMAMRAKRSSGLGVCACLDQHLQCLNDQSCVSKSQMLEELCNWNMGRTFGDCAACSSLGVEPSGELVSSTEIQIAFENLYPSIAEAIPLLVSDISAVTITYDESADVFLADVTLASGVVASDVAYNKMVYQLSRIFDVYPGVITWNSVGTKRQSSNVIEISIVDEYNPSSSSSALLASSFGLLVLLLNVLF